PHDTHHWANPSDSAPRSSLQCRLRAERYSAMRSPGAPALRVGRAVFRDPAARPTCRAPGEGKYRSRADPYDPPARPAISTFRSCGSRAKGAGLGLEPDCFEGLRTERHSRTRAVSPGAPMLSSGPPRGTQSRPTPLSQHKRLWQGGPAHLLTCPRTVK